MNKKDNYLALAFSTLLLGIAVGISSLILNLFLTLVEQTFLNFKETARQPFSINITPVHRTLSLLLGGLIAAVVWYVVRKNKSVVSIPDAIKGEKMSSWQTIGDVLTQIFFVGSGGSVGRELAPRELGALLAQKWMDYSHPFKADRLTENDRKLLIAAAAGAGLAGTYHAPITGIFFCMEILLKKFSWRNLIVSSTMSAISTLVVASITGIPPYYLTGELHYSLNFLLFVLIVSPLCGLAGALFRRAFTWAKHTQVKNKTILYSLPIASLITALIALYLPQITGNGRALAQANISLQNIDFPPILLVGALLKAAVTILTIRLGASGGTLTPSIAIGTTIGAVLAITLAPLLAGISIWQGALLGGCAVLAAAQQAPLMALFMVIEISHLSIWALPLFGLSAFLSFGIVAFLKRN